MKKRTIAVIVLAAVVLVGGVFLWRQHRQQQEAAAAAATQAEDEETSTVRWQGKTWTYNKNISNYLLLGIDTREQTDTHVGRTDAGQADALFVLSLNRKSGEVTIISIPRDTMTAVESFDLEGKSLGTSTDHISLSYGYGDGGQKSCKLTQKAVEHLLYGVPIQGFYAMNLDGLSALAESIGGVKVTVPNDSLASQDLAFTKGAEVTLDADNIETFVRSRDTDASQSALARLERQQAFIHAFVEQVRMCYDKDTSSLKQLYGALEPYTVTNISLDRLLDLAKTADQGDGYTEWTIPGEGTSGDNYDEYHVDDDALYEQIIHTFYKEVK